MRTERLTRIVFWTLCVTTALLAIRLFAAEKRGGVESSLQFDKTELTFKTHVLPEVVVAARAGFISAILLFVTCYAILRWSRRLCWLGLAVVGLWMLSAQFLLHL